jgi:PIN domain nuclease of toxin-antitoxin system
VSVYVTDTHPLLYYATNTKRKMSPKAWKAFEAAWNGEALIHVPAPVLWEVCNLVKSGTVILSEPFRRWVERIMNHPGFDVFPVDHLGVGEVNDSPFTDPYDAAIAGAARLLELPLITRDSKITDSGWVEIYW